MKNRVKTLLIAAMTAATGLSFSGIGHAAPATIGSCYDAVSLGDVQPPKITRDLYILVDQTAVLDKKLHEEAYQKIISFLNAGDGVHVIGFSANAAGYYTEVILQGVIDARLENDVRYSISKKSLRQLDTCQKDQDTAVRTYTGRALLQAFNAATSDLPKTEILSNLDSITKNILGPSAPTEKFILIISDMMENSDLLSLYGNRLNSLSADSEIAKLEKKLGFADMQGSKVYVIGGGYLPDGKYRSSIELKNLETFWRSYFDHSNAQLRQFGTPSLLGEIGN